MNKAIVVVLITVCSLGWSSLAHAILYDQNVTNNVIFGSGNANGAFTVDRANGVEVGLRGKLRFDGANNNQPQNVFNSMGNGDYWFGTGAPNPINGGLPPWADATTPIWNFDWSINVNHDGSAPGRNLGSAGLTYSLQIDFNPTAADIPDVTFDPINFATFDHSFGTNATASGGGLEAPGDGAYLTLVNTNNLAQNSWSMEFFDVPASPYAFDPNVTGIYTITLSAFNGVSVLATTSVNIITAVPEPGAFLFGGLVCGVIGAGVGGRRLLTRLQNNG